jgi:crotonobetainyl-CoA:carnitine CoA-transferase CaiB-like acyl-CoA transferase
LVDGTSAFFLAVNRNKRSLTLDLRRPAGREIFYRLVKEYDVVIESFRPGVMERLGCGYDELKKIKPELVYASLTGYGQAGPKAQKAGHDLNYMAESGVLGTTAGREIPSLSGIQVADVAGGALYAVSAVLAACIRAQRDKTGSFLDISMTDGLVSMLPILSAYYYSIGLDPGPNAMMLNGQLACYAVYQTRDEREISLGALEEKFWHNFCRAAGCMELAEGDHRDLARQADLKAALTRLFASRTAAEWEDLLAGRDTCCEVLKTFAEVTEDPHFRARGLFWELALDEQRRLLQTNTAVVVDGARPETHRPAPALGGDTDTVLENLGLGPDEITDLRRQGII